LTSDNNIIKFKKPVHDPFKNTSFIGRMKYANFFRILGFHELHVKIISIKTIKDLKYFTWCAMILKYLFKTVLVFT